VPTACGSARTGFAGCCTWSLVTPEIVTGILVAGVLPGVFRFIDVQLGMHTVILAHVSFSFRYVVIVVTID